MSVTVYVFDEPLNAPLIVTVSEIECLPEHLAGSSLPIENYSSRQSVNDVA